MITAMITKLGTVVSTIPATDTGGRTLMGPLRARLRCAYPRSSASPHRSGAGSMAVEGTTGGGSWKGHRERQDDGGRPRRAARGMKTEARAHRRSDAPGQRKGGYEEPPGGHGTRDARKSCEWSDGEWEGSVRMWVRASLRRAHVGVGLVGAVRARRWALVSAMATAREANWRSRSWTALVARREDKRCRSRKS
jgi:hypothetical protein